MVFLVAIVTQWTGFQFSLIASEHYAGDTDRLTRLFGTFNLGMGIAAFIIQLAATGPALRRFGVGVTVLLLPVALAVRVGADDGGAVLLRGGADQRLRPGPALLDRQGDVRAALSAAAVAREVRRQGRHRRARQPRRRRRRRPAPRPGDERLRRRHDRDPGPRSRPARPRHLLRRRAAPSGSAWRWSCAAATCWRSRTACTSTGSTSSAAATASMDRSASAVLAKAFDAGDPEAILYVLRAFAQSGRRPPLDAVRALLTHETPAVRARALAALRAAPDLTIRAEAERLLHDPDIEVRTEALLWLAYHARVDPLAQIDALGEFADFSIRASMVALYSRPGRYENLEAARVLLGTMASERGAGRPPRPHRGGDAARPPVRRRRRGAGRSGDADRRRGSRGRLARRRRGGQGVAPGSGAGDRDPARGRRRPPGRAGRAQRVRAAGAAAAGAAARRTVGAAGAAPRDPRHRGADRHRGRRAPARRTTCSKPTSRSGCA